MLRENKNLRNLKDINSPLPNLPLTKEEEQGGGLSYRKTNKLITALYMVTDIMDSNEPLKNKLRTLGLEILSDTFVMSKVPLDIAVGKIDQIMSFLDIAYNVNIISAMNCNILRKEFLLLDQSIKELIGDIKSPKKEINLSEFLKEEFSPLLDKEGVGGGNYRDSLSNLSLVKGEITTSSRWSSGPSSSIRRRENSKGHYSIGHKYSTRIGVQKGSTLLKALSDKTRLMSDKNNSVQYKAKNFRSEFDMLKKQRRDDIISVIKSINGNGTIKNIKDKAQVLHRGNSSLASCGEKTLQRELISMVKDGVLNKAGEKRWSRYFLVSRL